MRETRSRHGQQRHLACLVVAQHDRDCARQLQLGALDGYLRNVLLGGILLLLLLATTILLLSATPTRGGGNSGGAVAVELVYLCNDRLARLLAREGPIVDLGVRIAEGRQGGHSLARVEAGGVVPPIEGLQWAVGRHIAFWRRVQSVHMA